MRPGISLAVAVVLAGACGCHREPPACDALAAVVARCDPRTSQRDWADLCTLAVLSDDCRRAVEGASCSQHASAVPSYRATCFPACDAMATPATCNSDGTVTQCVGALGGMVRYRCTAVCAASGKRYTGTCGPEYRGHASTNGRAACWCE